LFEEKTQLGTGEILTGITVCIKMVARLILSGFKYNQQRFFLQI